jgi:hypothetical protein
VTSTATGLAARDRQFRSAIHVLARRLGFDDAQLRGLRLHGSGIYLLTGAGIVARAVQATDENRRRADTAVRITSWLAGLDYPAVRPVHELPTEFDGVVVTWWSYLPQPASPPRIPSTVLGRLLRDLHDLPPLPFRVPVAAPLERLRRALSLDDARERPVLGRSARTFLAERAAELQARYDGVQSHLGAGLVHNDAHRGNLLARRRSPSGYVLGDWDGACWGPREIDLVLEGAAGRLFGGGPADRAAFTRGYGFDVTRWPGWTVLRDCRELHSLAAYIRTAPDKPAAAHELHTRVRSLQTGSADDWRVVP